MFITLIDERIENSLFQIHYSILTLSRGVRRESIRHAINITDSDAILLYCDTHIALLIMNTAEIYII